MGTIKTFLVQAAIILALLAVPGLAMASSVRPPADATIDAGPPATPTTPSANAVPDVQTGAQNHQSDTIIWRDIRQGEAGKVTIPDQKSATLIQSEGELWRLVRNGPVSVYGAYLLLSMVFLLSVYFVLFGRMKIAGGRSGSLVARFNGLERFGHWLMAGSFIVLAISGLNMLFGRHILMPIIGKEAFSSVTMIGKYLHNYLALAFMLGVALVFILWVKDNIPNSKDLVWLMKGGGFLNRDVHVSSRKFNAGQKIIFWLVVLFTISVSLSGIALLFPFETSFMAKTFALLNIFGTNLPIHLSPLQEQQLNQLWHAIAGMVFIAVILAHIYIGTVGMEGGFDAMGSGQVDLNWAKEHHDLWLEELGQNGQLEVASSPSDQKPQPAE